MPENANLRSTPSWCCRVRFKSRFQASSYWNEHRHVQGSRGLVDLCTTMCTGLPSPVLVLRCSEVIFKNIFYFPKTIYSIRCSWLYKIFKDSSLAGKSVSWVGWLSGCEARKNSSFPRMTEVLTCEQALFFERKLVRKKGAPDRKMVEFSHSNENCRTKFGTFFLFQTCFIN